MKTPKTRVLLFFLLSAAVCAAIAARRWPNQTAALWNRATGVLLAAEPGQTVNGRLDQIHARAALGLGGELGEGRLPSNMRLVMLKEEKRLELHVKFSKTNAWRHVKTYPVVAASGKAGPKLREGDRQVPEGEYGIESLNPNSNFYLALKVAYPSREDVEMAKRDGRATDNLGSWIMIHGNGGSIGCIAVSNAHIEEIFWLAARVGLRNVELLSAPFDFRARGVAVPSNAPRWTAERYERLKARMMESPKTAGD